jgi:hypothetical protein
MFSEAYELADRFYLLVLKPTAFQTNPKIPLRIKHKTKSVLNYINHRNIAEIFLF